MASNPDDADVRVRKRQVRRLLRQRLAVLTPEGRHVQSAAIARRAVELPEWQRAGVVMLYLSLPDEVETAGLLERALAEGKRLCVPKIVDPAACRMVAVPIRSLAPEELEHAHFGVRTPTGEAEPVSPAEIDLLFVPGLGFSLSGHRIGRGAGYYDRFLAQPGLRARLCGLAFKEQVLDVLPADAHDRAMEVVITPEQALRFDA